MTFDIIVQFGKVGFRTCPETGCRYLLQKDPDPLRPPCVNGFLPLAPEGRSIPSPSMLPRILTGPLGTEAMTSLDAAAPDGRSILSPSMLPKTFTLPGTEAMISLEAAAPEGRSMELVEMLLLAVWLDGDRTSARDAPPGREPVYVS